MLRKPHLILLIVVALGVLVLLALPEGTRARLKVAFTGLFLPLFGLAASAQSAAERGASALTPRSVLLSRIQQLEEDNEQLRLTATEALAAARENDRLRQMLAYAPRVPWRLQAARVIGRDPANWWRSVHIDVGQRHGVVPDLAVLTPEGLVGRVAEVGALTSRVVLVGDPNCPVSASPVDSATVGIIRGSSSSEMGESLVELSFLSRYSRVKPGQRVLTSGQGGVYPPGILVGEIVDARAVGDGIYLEARVRLAANLAGLDRVWVKLP